MKKLSDYKQFPVHDPDSEDVCPICQNELRLIIDEAYKDLEIDEQFLVDLYGTSGKKSLKFNEKILHWHMKATGITKAREENTDSVMRLIVKQGAEGLRKGNIKIDGKLLMQAVKHKDEKTGSMPPRVLDGSGGHTLVIAPVPIPGLFAPADPEPIQVKGRVIPDEEEDSQGGN
jgi:hypothetical protein